MSLVPVAAPENEAWGRVQMEATLLTVLEVGWGEVSGELSYGDTSHTGQVGAAVEEYITAGLRVGCDFEAIFRRLLGKGQGP